MAVTDPSVRRFLSKAEVAAQLGVCKHTVRKMVIVGNLPPPVRITDRTIGWPVAAFDAWCASRPLAA